jgi:predicted lipoprotein with Yx(FWY)xxD motif
MERTGTAPSARRRSALARLAAIAAAVAAMAAVGLAPGLAGATTRSQTTASEVTTEKNAKLGTILVAGNTVYTQKGKACAGACLKTWTPVVLPDGTTTASAGSGVDAAKLGTKTTASGALQITYGGKPLFWCTKDKAPGDVKGNVSDKFGKWSAVVIAKANGGGSPSTTNAGTGGAAF